MSGTGNTKEAAVSVEIGSSDDAYALDLTGSKRTGDGLLATILDSSFSFAGLDGGGLFEAAAPAFSALASGLAQGSGAFDDPTPVAAGGGLDDPQENGSGATTTVVAASSNLGIDGILAGVRWNGPISYSTPDASGDYPVGYNSDNNLNLISAQFEGFSQYSAGQTTALHFALNDFAYTQPASAAGFSVEGFTGLGIGFAGAGAGTGTIRAANSSDPGTSYAYYPNSGIYGGDVWTGTSARNPIAGNYDWYTSLHEIGHALGLAHGHTGGAYGPLPAAFDSGEFSVMTYHSYIGHDLGTYNYLTNGPWDAPQTYMMLDIAALQYMYGADFGINSGDTIYSWSPTTGQTFVNGSAAITPGGNRIYMTVWDGGGTDTYDLSNYTTNLNIDLNPGGYSTLSSAQLADLGFYGPGAGIEMARGNVFNALLYQGNTASLIENAIGGSGNDLIVGNQVKNSLAGNDGNDTLGGGGGWDYLVGGAGGDRLYGGGGNDTLGGGGGWDRLYGSNGGDRLYGGGGSDTLGGGGGWDRLYGGTGGDQLYGGVGNDTLDGGDGWDRLVGGGDNDRFVFANGFGQDSITDFSSNNAEDIDLSAVTAIVDFTDLVNNHLRVDDGGTGFAEIFVGVNSILLNGIFVGQIGVGLAYSEFDFIFV